jgi:hypothetical protein
MSLLVLESLVKHKMTVIPQPSCPPDLAPVDFVLPPPHQVEIHCERSSILGNRRDGRKFATEHMHYPAKRVSELEKGCWKWCIDSGGEYFEGDKSYYIVSLSVNVLKR